MTIQIMDNTILNTILKDTYSLGQFKHRLRILKSNLLKTFFGGEEENASPSPEDLNWLKSLPDNFYQKFNKENVYEIFSGLEKKSVGLPTLTIYLTFEPNDENLTQLGSFSRKTFNLPSLLLDTKLNPDLIAGTALVWKGIYKDYSLKSKIEARKEEMTTGFKRFLK